MSLEVVLFDDVELVVSHALKAALDARSEPYTDSVYVSNQAAADAVTSEPVTRTRMVTIRRDGGPRLMWHAMQPASASTSGPTTEQDCNDLARMCLCTVVGAPRRRPDRPCRPDIRSVRHPRRPGPTAT